MVNIPKETKKKLIDMIVTALISACIAFLQSLLVQNGSPAEGATMAMTAGPIALLIRGATLV